MSSSWCAENEHKPTDVYRMFDADGRLLYVGMTTCWENRVAGHRNRTPWYAEVADVQFVTYPTRSAALTAERAAIASESPAYNVRHNVPTKKARGRYAYLVQPRFDVGPDGFIAVREIVGAA